MAAAVALAVAVEAEEAVGMYDSAYHLASIVKSCCCQKMKWYLMTSWTTSEDHISLYRRSEISYCHNSSRHVTSLHTQIPEIKQRCIENLPVEHVASEFFLALDVNHEPFISRCRCTASLP
jgi:hypothetical protein